MEGKNRKGRFRAQRSRKMGGAPERGGGVSERKEAPGEAKNEGDLKKT